MARRQTPSQTVGPFFGPALAHSELTRLENEQSRGERIVVGGRVLDGDGEPVPEALIEIWQANADGKYDHPADTNEARNDPNFHGFGRCATDAHGKYRFSTIRPGAAADSSGAIHAPHINVSVFARGLLNRVVTRIYFPHEKTNEADPVLMLVPGDRRATLIARLGGSPPSAELTFDIVLQGAGETVFFDI